MIQQKLIQRVNEFDLTLQDVKAHLVVEHSLDDSLIELYLAAAIEYVENATRRALSVSKYEITVPHFSGSEDITLSLSPIRAVSTITYKDTDVNGTQFDLLASEYDVRLNSDWVYLVPDGYWPSGCEMKFTVLAGYGEIGTAITGDTGTTYTDELGVFATPAPIKLAVMMLTAHWYTNRESVSAIAMNKVPAGVDALLSKYRNIKAYA